MYAIIEEKINSIFRDLGYNRNSKNKKIKEEFKDKNYSINKVESITHIGDSMSEYRINIDVGYQIVDSNEFAEKQGLFDTIIYKIAKIEEVTVIENAILDQLSKNPLKLIGNIVLIAYNDFKC